MKIAIQFIGTSTSDAMKKLGQSHLAFAIVSIFIAMLTLFYIFDSMGRLADGCKVQNTDVCKQLSGPSFPMLVILLIIAGFVMIISTVVYILVFTQGI